MIFLSICLWIFGVQAYHESAAEWYFSNYLKSVGILFRATILCFAAKALWP